MTPQTEEALSGGIPLEALGEIEVERHGSGCWTPLEKPFRGDSTVVTSSRWMNSLAFFDPHPEPGFPEAQPSPSGLHPSSGPVSRTG